MPRANVGRVDLDFSGLDGLTSELKRRQVAKKSVQAAAKVVLPAAKSLAPRRTGTLRQAQSVRAEAGSRGETGAFAVVGARKKVTKSVTLPGRRKPQQIQPALYQHLVALGTRPHSLGRAAKLARKNKPGDVAVGQQGAKKHPGARANNFLKKALDSVASQAGAAGSQAAIVETQKAIEKEAAKLAAKGKT